MMRPRPIVAMRVPNAPGNHFRIPLLLVALFGGFSQGFEASPVPEVSFEALDFTSNIHNLRRDGARLSQAGEKYPDIEWRSGQDAVAPILHAADKPVKADLLLQLKGVRPGAKLAVTGESETYLTLDLKGETTIGSFIEENEIVRVPVTAAKNLAKGLKKMKDRIRWKLELTQPTGERSEADLGTTSGVVCYLAFTDVVRSSPDAYQPTPNRIEHAYNRFNSAVGTLELQSPWNDQVHSLSKQVGRYYNPVNHFDDDDCWFVPGTWGVRGGGASCISIVRYCRAVLEVLGYPGTIRMDAVYARPETPTMATLGGIDSPDIYKNGLKLFLVDNRNTANGSVGGFGGMNNYEGVLIYTGEKGTVYFPGGTQYMYSNINQVLGVFRALVWARWDSRAQNWQVAQIVHAYQAGVRSYGRISSYPYSRPGDIGIYDDMPRYGLFGRRR